MSSHSFTRYTSGMEFSLAKRWFVASFILLAVAGNVFVYTRVLQQPGTPELTVSFLNIGQGDAILIQSPTGVKMLVDGGPDQSVLRELGKVLWPWDRHIDVLVETHPDKDHISGLGDVLERYHVDYFLESGVPDKTAVSEHVKELAGAEPGIKHLIIHRGERLQLGGGAYADVLSPDTDQSNQKVTNDGSVVLHIVYGNTSIMLTGDLPSTLEDHVVQLDGDSLKSDILKAGHHGSKYSSDERWLSAVAPETVVISAGRNNPYGHPNEETLARIRKEGAGIVSTVDSGTITFTSDGTHILKK